MGQGPSLHAVRDRRGVGGAGPAAGRSAPTHSPTTCSWWPRPTSAPCSDTSRKSTRHCSSSTRCRRSEPASSSTGSVRSLLVSEGHGRAPTTVSRLDDRAYSRASRPFHPAAYAVAATLGPVRGHRRCCGSGLPECRRSFSGARIDPRPRGQHTVGPGRLARTDRAAVSCRQRPFALAGGCSESRSPRRRCGRFIAFLPRTPRPRPAFDCRPRSCCSRW